MVLWRPKESEVDIRERADAVVQKRKVLLLSRQMATHAALLQAQANELKEMLEREGIR